ncbi:50S ribosomal protein L23 [Candidatus Berkelbacteria bacterium]|nr:50S ribosomal protein L23 [Candidatus Berkelbacteria bacterium]
MNVLLRPIITEKSLRLATNGQYSFVVDQRANKVLIAQTIHELYRVDVLHVTVRNMAPRLRRTRRGLGQTRGSKQAIAKLKPKQKIPGFEVPTEENTPKTQQKGDA